MELIPIDLDVNPVYQFFSARSINAIQLMTQFGAKLDQRDEKERMFLHDKVTKFWQLDLLEYALQA